MQLQERLICLNTPPLRWCRGLRSWDLEDRQVADKQNACEIGNHPIYISLVLR